VLSASDVGAGNYGPKTKQALLDALTQHIYEQKLIEREQDNPIEQESAEIMYFTA